MPPYIYLSIREIIAATRPSPLGRRYAFEQALRETLNCDVRIEDLVLSGETRAALFAWVEANEPS